MPMMSRRRRCSFIRIRTTDVPSSRAFTYDRLGLTEETTDILGIQVPSVTIPVGPGRNLAIIVEAAAINYRVKKMGYNAAQDLVSRVFPGKSLDG